MIDGSCLYVEIGSFAGGSAALMSSNELETEVISIDLGHTINPSIVLQNVEKFKNVNNKFSYIKGNSTDIDTINKLKDILNGRKIDILFIDGDHSYDGVIADYRLYNGFVADGGYIIFDDYMDKEHSPDVRLAVDYLVKEMELNYTIIGTIPNTHGARPKELATNNCFIVKKKQ
jgi:cephalosporin hydroxylase